MNTYAWDSDVYIELTNVHEMDDRWSVGVFGWSKDHVVMILHGTEEGKIKDGYGVEFEPDFIHKIAYAWAKNEGLPVKKNSVVELVVCYPTRVRSRYPEAWRDHGVEIVGWWDEPVYARPMTTKTGCLLHVFPESCSLPV